MKMGRKTSKSQQIVRLSDRESRLEYENLTLRKKVVALDEMILILKLGNTEQDKVIIEQNKEISTLKTKLALCVFSLADSKAGYEVLNRQHQQVEILLNEIGVVN